AVDPVGVVTFSVEGHDPGLVAAYLSAEHGIGVRDGRFCAHPLLARLGYDSGAIRASVGVGTTGADVVRLVEAVRAYVEQGPAARVWGAPWRRPRRAAAPPPRAADRPSDRRPRSAARRVRRAVAERCPPRRSTLLAPCSACALICAVLHDVVLSGHGFRLEPLAPEHAETLAGLVDEAMWSGMSVPMPFGVAGMAELVAATRAAPDLTGFVVRAVDADGRPGAVLGSTAFRDLSLVDRRVEIGRTFYARTAWGSLVNPVT